MLEEHVWVSQDPWLPIKQSQMAAHDPDPREGTASVADGIKTTVRSVSPKRVGCLFLCINAKRSTPYKAAYVLYRPATQDWLHDGHSPSE